MSTIRELLKEAEGVLAPFDTARLDTEVLLAFLFNIDRSHLYARMEEEVSTGIHADFHSLLARRRDGFPIAYLTGTREFWSLELNVTQDTLIPRPETECLIELALDLIPQDSEAHILDLGTGSGAIAIAIARERPRTRIVAVDISAAALAVAQENIRYLQIPNIRLQQSNWFRELDRQSFDLIISNPPYVESQDKGFSHGEIRFEPRLALDGGHQGMEAINMLIPSAIQHLNKEGCLILEHGHSQGEAVRRLFEFHLYSDITTRTDYAGLERVSMGRFR